LATLNAEWCSEEASEGAWWAPSRSIRASTGLTIEEANAMANTHATAMTGEATVKAMSVSTAAIEVNATNRPRSGKRSAAWPPARLPSVIPTPNTTSVHAIAKEPKPVFSDSSGVR
jgi:hypothetical protein